MRTVGRAPWWRIAIDVALAANAPTPAYVYDLDAIESEADALESAFGAAFGEDARSVRHAVFYAVKANSAGSIVRALASRGFGADVVTGAELALALRCGIDAEAIVYSGVAKSDDELDLAVSVGARGIRAIQVESIEEIVRVDARAKAAGRNVRIAIRVNPGLDLDELATHAHVATGHDEAKFGVMKEDLPHALAAITSAKNVSLVGISSHVGSQFFVTAPYVSAARTACEIARAIREKNPLEFVDTGGGFGVDYSGEKKDVARPADFVRAALDVMKTERVDDLALHIEPGRALVARHGVLVARVIQRKESPSSGKNWLMIDAGMNDLIRPALYQAKHRIVSASDGPMKSFRVVGPICESSDDFGEHAFGNGHFDHVAILDAGAYGFTMASRYNGRALASEIFVREVAGKTPRVVSISPRAPAEAWADERAKV